MLAAVILSPYRSHGTAHSLLPTSASCCRTPRFSNAPSANSLCHSSVPCLVVCDLNSEVAFYCLNAINPVTHAVANTLKRVFLIAVSITMFGHKLTPLGGIGSAVAIGGVLLYSLAKQKFPKK